MGQLKSRASYGSGAWAWHSRSFCFFNRRWNFLIFKCRFKPVNQGFAAPKSQPSLLLGDRGPSRTEAR